MAPPTRNELLEALRAITTFILDWEHRHATEGPEDAFPPTGDLNHALDDDGWLEKQAVAILKRSRSQERRRRHALVAWVLVEVQDRVEQLLQLPTEERQHKISTTTTDAWNLLHRPAGLTELAVDREWVERNLEELSAWQENHHDSSTRELHGEVTRRIKPLFKQLLGEDLSGWSTVQSNARVLRGNDARPASAITSIQELEYAVMRGHLAEADTERRLRLFLEAEGYPPAVVAAFARFHRCVTKAAE